MKLSYRILLGQIPMILVDTTLSLETPRYEMTAALRPVPLFGLLFDGTVDARAAGSIRPEGLRPRRYQLDSVIQGKAGSVIIGYPKHDLPQRLLPPLNQDFASLAPALQGARDPITALIEIAREVALSARCPDRIAFYDGWRRSDVAIESLAPRPIPQAAGVTLAPAGPLTLCRFTLAQDPNEDAQAGQQDYRLYMTGGLAWFGAPTAGMPPVPLYVETEGGPAVARLRLDGAEPLNPAPAAAPTPEVESAPLPSPSGDATAKPQPTTLAPPSPVPHGGAGLLGRNGDHRVTNADDGVVNFEGEISIEPPRP